jgi:hypothetical protein
MQSKCVRARVYKATKEAREYLHARKSREAREAREARDAREIPERLSTCTPSNSFKLTCD